MRISVVLPNFKDTRIARALASIREQEFKNIEVVVVHGGPMNEELKSIYAKYCVDTLIHEPDKGIFDALNKGVQAATAPVIYLMGADDYVSDSQVFSSVAREFEANEKLDGVCMGCTFVGATGKVIRRWFPKRVSAGKIKRGIFPPHFSLFLKKEVYQLVGPFKYQETRNVATDIIWLLDLAILKPNLHIKTLQQHFLNMEYGGASTGSWRAVIKQFRIVHEYASLVRKDLKQWYLLSVVRTGSKVFQFRLW